MAKFTEYINVLAALANAPGGLTAGQVRRQSQSLMDNQKITRILRSLEEDGMVWSKQVLYRPGVHKVVWRALERASADCSSVSTAYAENEGVRPPEPETYPKRYYRHEALPSTIDKKPLSDFGGNKI
jgi:DNA-binding HxlR family transcriptional regulator